MRNSQNLDGVGQFIRSNSDANSMNHPVTSGELLIETDKALNSAPGEALLDFDPE